MIIRIALISLVCLLFLWFIKQRTSIRSQAWSKMIALLLFVFAVVAILFPDSTNQLAHQVGVGRGADLLLYTVTIVLLMTLLRQYAQRQADAAKLVQLSRQLAIIEARQNPHNVSLHKGDKP